MITRLTYFSFIAFLIFSQAAQSQNIRFSDVAEAMGVTFPIQNYHGSVAFVDFDSDGLDDLSFSSRVGYPVFIFKNEVTAFTDIADQLGLDVEEWSMQILWADYDNDGDKDLFIAFDKETTHNRLYRNDEAAGFTDVTALAGLNLEPASTHVAAWGDYNNDGYLDLFVTHYSEFTRNYLYRNNGNGTFTDVTFEAGVSGETSVPGYFKHPLAVSFLDFNNDGWADLYIANDKLTGSFLYRNNGDGTFTDISESSGTDAVGFMMSVSVGDINEDGYLDIYTTNDPPGNYLYLNNGDETFTNIAGESGVAVYKSCWGSNFFDYDNDGYLDLYVSVAAASPNLSNPLFKNNGDGTFTQLNEPGLTGSYSSYGNAVGDFNNDGFYDIVVNNANHSPNLYQNPGGDNNWIKLNLTGVISNRDAIGSRIEVYFDGRKIIRETTCGISYSSQNSSSNIIGVGTAEIVDSIIIKWPASGLTSILRSAEVNRVFDIVEGQTTDIDEHSVNLPFSFKLHQNYPNPFNPGTKISWQSPVSGHQTLIIYDILGNEITTIVDEYKPAGYYEVTFNAGGLTSGLYIYKFQAGEFSAARKMLFIK